MIKNNQKQDFENIENQIDNSLENPMYPQDYNNFQTQNYNNNNGMFQQNYNNSDMPSQNYDASVQHINSRLLANDLSSHTSADQWNNGVYNFGNDQQYNNVGNQYTNVDNDTDFVYIDYNQNTDYVGYDYTQENLNNQNSNEFTNFDYNNQNIEYSNNVTTIYIYDDTDGYDNNAQGFENLAYNSVEGEYSRVENSINFDPDASGNIGYEFVTDENGTISYTNDGMSVTVDGNILEKSTDSDVQENSTNTGTIEKNSIEVEELKSEEVSKIIDQNMNNSLVEKKPIRITEEIKKHKSTVKLVSFIVGIVVVLAIALTVGIVLGKKDKSPIVSADPDVEASIVLNAESLSHNNLNAQFTVHNSQLL